MGVGTKHQEIRDKLPWYLRHSMDDTALLYRPLLGVGTKARLCPKCLDTLRVPRAGLSSSVDT